MSLCTKLKEKVLEGPTPKYQQRFSSDGGIIDDFVYFFVVLLCISWILFIEHGFGFVLKKETTALRNKVVSIDGNVVSAHLKDKSCWKEKPWIEIFQLNLF